MKLPRRNFLHLAAGAAALPAISRVARAQTYPTRSVRIIVGYAAGGAPDILARLMGNGCPTGSANRSSSRTGREGSIAIETVIKAAADGYTLLLMALPDAVNTTLYPNPNYMFVRDVIPVAGISRDPDVMSPIRRSNNAPAFARVHPRIQLFHLSR
jgi:tripartite-type tricarboxylate transporter receptor subunit TctC